MKRIFIALLILSALLSLCVACTPKYSPVKDKNASVSVNSQNAAVGEVVIGPKTVILTEAHAQEFLSYLDQLEDGTSHLCDCQPDVSITIGDQTFYYHSRSGVLTEEGDKSNIYYVGDNREAINEILKQYITLRP